MIKRHDYGAIHEALNKMIIAELKAWLEQMPAKTIRKNGHTLCRIVIGSCCEYSPRNIAVDEAWVDERDGLLHIYGRDLTNKDSFDQNWADNVEPDEWTEEADLYDITDFGYLIDQIAEQLEMPEGAWYIMEGYMASSCYRMEENMKQAVEKEVTV